MGTMKKIFFLASIILYAIVEEDITDKLSFLLIMSFLFYIDNNKDEKDN